MKLSFTARNRRVQNARASLAGISPEAGVALVETLVAILIFSFGILGLIGLEASAVNFSVDAEDRNRATVLANDIASTMWLNLVNGSVNMTTLAASVATLQTNCQTSTQPVYLPSCSIPTPTLVAGTTNTYTITITWTPTTDKTSTPRNFTTQVTVT